MGYQLTYSDREFLLQTFDTLKAEWDGEDEQLLADACNWAKQLVPNCGFEHSLVRDVAVLSRYLTSYKTDQDLSDIARGGLLYVLRANQYEPSRLGELGLLDDAFISSYAVHEIRVRLGEQAIYNPPRLTKDEQRHAENLFLELAERPISNDQELIEKSQIVCDGLANLAACGLFQRLKRNINFLISVVLNADWTHEQRCYARAALSYLVFEEDAIDDRLGIVGYLDDNFVAQMAIDLIEPNREPWLDILDATVGAWPFLNAIVIDDGSGERPISEYMIVNSALSCAQVRGEHCGMTVLVVPYVGPTPLLLGFIATLGLVQQSGQRDVTENSFFLGQKVLVDNYAVAVFAGIEEINGRRMFKLTQDHCYQGHHSPCTHYWPISDLRRLIPADEDRTTRGKLMYDVSKSNAMLPALEYLFNASKAAHPAAVGKKVLVVTPVKNAYDLAKRLRLYNHPLKEVVPMGHLVSNKIKPWSNRFGQQEPLLVFISDLDVACVYAEERSESIESVIIDMTGRNLNKFVSLGELRHMNFRTLLISPERSAGELSFIIDDDSAGVWEWDTVDLSALLWPHDKATDRDGVITRYERRLQTLSSAEPQVRRIDCSLADEVFESVKYLELLARQRGQDSLAELDELVVLAFGVTSRLLRSATLLTDDLPSFLRIEKSMKRIDDITRESRYLSEAEQSAAVNTRALLQRFFDQLKVNNPKAAIVRELLRVQPRQTIICPDARILADLEHAYRNKGLCILSDYDPTDEVKIDGAIIPGWFRRDRMARLLIPPITQPLDLLLYNLERRWHAGFCLERQKSRKRRARRGKRSKLFPNVRGWGETSIEAEQSTEAEHGSSLRELEAIQKHVHAARRQRAYRTAKSDGTEAEVPAHLVLFEGGAHAFLRESYKATVVTHLLDTTVEDTEEEDLDVSQKTVKELKPGDALLFHRRSDRDVIRMTADEDMPDGLRDTAVLWQKALVNYARRENMKPKDIWQRLRKEGCPLHLQTIRGWMDDNEMIAPRQYERDVAIIAKVTGDPRLNSQFETVLNAISTVFGAHQRASHKLARQVLSRAIEILKEEHHQSGLIELESDIVLARVIEIDDCETQVRVSMVNRLQESEQWHE